MVLGKLPVPGRPTHLDKSRARAYYACSRCGWGLFVHFSLSRLSFLSPSPWETARYRLKYCLKGLLSPKQPTNQLIKSRNYHKYQDTFTSKCTCIINLKIPKIKIPGVIIICKYCRFR